MAGEWGYGDDDRADQRKREWLFELEKLRSTIKCLHQSCPNCHGSGRKATGEPCVHMLSCQCPKCSPRF